MQFLKQKCRNIQFGSFKSFLTFALFTRSTGSFAEAASGAIAVFTQRKIAGVVCKAAA